MEPRDKGLGQFESDVVLRDGSLVHVRELRPEDRELLSDFFGGLSSESVSSRFFGLGANLQRATETLVASPGLFALVALREGRIIAVASLHPADGDTSKKAEVGVA